MTSYLKKFIFQLLLSSGQINLNFTSATTWNQKRKKIRGKPIYSSKDTVWVKVHGASHKEGESLWWEGFVKEVCSKLGIKDRVSYA